MGLRTSALWLASLGLQRWRRAPAQVADGRLSQPQRRLRWRSLGTQVPAVRSQRGRRSVRRALRMDATCPVHVASLYGDSEADIDVWRVLREPLGTFRPGLRARGGGQPDHGLTVTHPWPFTERVTLGRPWRRIPGDGVLPSDWL